jgi:hypothetical protein
MSIVSNVLRYQLYSNSGIAKSSRPPQGKFTSITSFKLQAPAANLLPRNFDSLPFSFPAIGARYAGRSHWHCGSTRKISMVKEVSEMRLIETKEELTMVQG